MFISRLPNRGSFNFDVFHSSDVSSSSDDEFVVDSLSEEELEKLIEAIEEKKKLIATLKTQHWPMHKKLSTLRSMTLQYKHRYGFIC